MAPTGDGGVHHHQPSCATAVPLGKSVRRALRTAIGIPKKKKKPQPRSSRASMELSLSSSPSVAARKEAVVRVVLRGGVVEVYPGVVLACTVIRNHPPGLCLAHPDVFRNPHGAVVCPLEPLFPGQKFLLLPETTVVRLKHKIPESSVGAFADDDDDCDDDGDEEEEETSSEGGGHSSGSGGGAASSSEEEEDSCMAAWSARGYFEARDRWSECRFRKLVEQGLAVAPSKDDDDDGLPAERKKLMEKPRTAAKKAAGSKKKRSKGKRRRDHRSSLRLPQLPMGLRAGFAAARRAWEPSLPSVEEEEDATVVSVAAVSPARHHQPSSEPEEIITRP